MNSPCYKPLKIMFPQKFTQSYKCECFQPHNYCNCMHKSIASDVLIRKVTDIAESLAEVMNLSGIFMIKAKATRDIIIYYFLHFEEIINRIDSIPRKRLNKEDLLYELGRKCQMNRMEAQMAYSIIKRAFKAFYHGTDLGGVPNNFLYDKLTHSSECLWVHAAQRTAQIYASYEGIFYSHQKNLERKINLVYKKLYERIANGKQSVNDYECSCLECVKRIAVESLKTVKVTTGMHVIDDPYEAMYLKEQEENVIDQVNKNGKLENNVKTRCTCPSLATKNYSYAYREIADSTNTGSSQGPFDCRWIPISKEEFETDEDAIDIKLPEEFSCSSSHKSEACSSEYECLCEDCTCKSDENIVCGEFDVENRTEMEHSFSTADISLQTASATDCDRDLNLILDYNKIASNSVVSPFE